MTTTAKPRAEQTSSVIAIYGSHDTAGAALKALNHQGFDMAKLSIFGKEYHFDGYHACNFTIGDQMTAWGKHSAFWGGLFGMLFGAVVFFVPGIGMVVIAGPMVAWTVSALEGEVRTGEVSALGAALVGLGIPKSSALKYESELQAGRFILLVHSSPYDAERATALLELTNHVVLDVYLDQVTHRAALNAPNGDADLHTGS
jgi:hypothetical protein